MFIKIISKRYHTVGTVLIYHTIGTVLIYHTVGTVLIWFKFYQVFSGVHVKFKF